MRRSEISKILQRISLPKELEHIILAEHDEIVGLRQDIKLIGETVSQLAGLIQAMSGITHGVAKMQDRINKNFSDRGVSLDSVAPEPDDVKTSSGF